MKTKQLSVDVRICLCFEVEDTKTSNNVDTFYKCEIKKSLCLLCSPHIDLDRGLVNVLTFGKVGEFLLCYSLVETVGAHVNKLNSVRVNTNFYSFK